MPKIEKLDKVICQENAKNIKNITGTFSHLAMWVFVAQDHMARLLGPRTTRRTLKGSAADHSIVKHCPEPSACRIEQAHRTCS